jgi:hypothetical protein
MKHKEPIIIFDHLEDEKELQHQNHDLFFRSYHNLKLLLYLAEEAIIIGIFYIILTEC